MATPQRYYIMRLNRLHESLDDKDEFRQDPRQPEPRRNRHPAKNCAFCQEVNEISHPFWYEDQAWSYEAYGVSREGKGNPRQFHMLHEHWAELNGGVNIWHIRDDKALADNFRQFMAKYGWVPKASDDTPAYSTLSWMKTSMREDLDDKDVFETADCTYCDTMDKLGVPGFHEAHAVARQEATKVAPWATELYKEKFKTVMLQHGWKFVQLPHHAESYKWDYIG